MTPEEMLTNLLVDILGSAPVTLALLYLIYSAETRDNSNTQLLSELLRECLAKRDCKENE